MHCVRPFPGTLRAACETSASRVSGPGDTIGDVIDTPAQLPPWDACHFLPSGATSILDVGCNVGAGLERAYRLGISNLYGIEINRHAVEAARERLGRLPGVDVSRIVHGSADTLPFWDASADVAMAIETMEHVPAALRPAVVHEVWRVLRPGAPFIITVPADGMFSWLDPSNVRLRFPRLFDRVSRAIGGGGRERGFEAEKHGIVWHHHFSVPELRALLEPAFQIERVRRRGCFVAPICAGLVFPFYRRQRHDHPIARLLQRLEAWDLSVETSPRFAWNVLVVARKPASP
jgi:SAM-dependent methyltransferase